MSEAASMAGDASTKDRQAVVEAVWLMTILLVMVVLGIPWFVRGLEIDFSRVAWVLFAYATIFLLGSRASAALGDSDRRTAISWTLQALGILTLSFVWYLAGHIYNPVFLVLFVPPVIASGLLSRPWQTIGLALFSVLVVTAVAIAASTELRWFLARSGVDFDWLPLRRGGPDSAISPFPGMSAPPSYHAFTLGTFALVLLAVAFVTEALNRLLTGLYARTAALALASQTSEGRYNEVIQRSPEPAVLFYSATGQVVQASRSFLGAMLLGREDLAGRSLEDLVDFVYPELVRPILQGGEVPYAAYRVGQETRVAQLVAWRVHDGQDDYTYLTLRDVKTLYYLATALDAVGEVYMILCRNRLVYFNAAAANLFSGLYAGIEADEAWGGRSQPDRWWELGLRPAQERRITVGDRDFAAVLSAAHIPGGSERLTLVKLDPRESA